MGAPPKISEDAKKKTKAAVESGVQTQQALSLRDTRKKLLMLDKEKFELESQLCYENPSKRTVRRALISMDVHVRRKITLIVIMQLISVLKFFASIAHEYCTCLSSGRDPSRACGR